MSAFIPPTPEPGDIDRDALAEELAVQAERLGEEDFRVLQFHVFVADVTGPVGPLLRMIAQVHDGFAEAKSQYGTTEGEANRLFAILEEAMDLLDVIRAGEA